jgi:hypothetical protein
MAEAVDLAKLLHGAFVVDRALECARAGRFADGDLASVIAHQALTGGGGWCASPPARNPRCKAPPAPGTGSVNDGPHPPPPPLPDELDRLLRRLRLPSVRRAAPEVIATAASQRWEHAEVLRVLLTEEASGREHATISMRRKASGLPAVKAFDAWEAGAPAIPAPTQFR